MTSPTDGTPAPDESPAPYGSGPAATSGSTTPKRVRVHHLRAMKERGERFAMLTSYDQMTAEIFDAAGLPVLLVGDSAANNVLGYDTTLPVSVDELIPLVRAVSRGARRALVVADLRGTLTEAARAYAADVAAGTFPAEEHSFT